jgi:pimeloyl-ACP methyl ester carboxylesterase
MIKILAAAAAVAFIGPVAAGVMPYPAGFRTETIPTNGTKLYVRVSGQGPAVVLDNKALFASVGKLTMPVLAVGGEKSSGKDMVRVLSFVATNVSGGIVPGSGHWIMEENPQATVDLVANFLVK